MWLKVTTREVEIIEFLISTQCRAFSVLLDLSEAMTDSFEGGGAYSRGGGLIGGFTVCT